MGACRMPVSSRPLPVDPAELQGEYDHYAASGVVSERFGHLILTLCQHMAYRPSFRSYTFRDDLVSCAVVNCLTAIRTYTPHRGPLARYLSHVVYMRMVKVIQRDYQRRSTMLESLRREPMPPSQWPRVTAPVHRSPARG